MHAPAPTSSPAAAAHPPKHPRASTTGSTGIAAAVSSAAARPARPSPAAANPALALIICDACPEHVLLTRQWWGLSVAPRWPIGAAPATHIHALTPLDRTATALAATKQLGAAILVPGRRTSPHDLSAAARACHELSIPVVVFATDLAGALQARLTADGALIIDPALEPAAAAGVLAGLLSAARARRHLESELDLAHQLHASARRWIRRVDDELHTAARMQRDLLPAVMPTQGVIETAALFKPLWHVSGDVYRAWALDGHHLGFMIADAMGHGVRAAMASMVLAHELDLTEDVPPPSGELPASARIIPPAQALARLNLQMRAHPCESLKFASALCGVIDTRTGDCTLAAAGHPHPLIISPTGAVRPFELDGAALGVFEDGEFTETAFTLAPGETLLLYTDGAEDAAAAIHARAAHRPDKGECLRSALASAFAGSENPMAENTLTQRLEAFGALLDHACGSLHRADDATALALRRAA
ncbi:hypothetical protein BH11PLA1_BH11PLA1_16430 [soil metagenome]